MLSAHTWVSVCVFTVHRASILPLLIDKYKYPGCKFEIVCYDRPGGCGVGGGRGWGDGGIRLK